MTAIQEVDHRISSCAQMNAEVNVYCTHYCHCQPHLQHLRNNVSDIEKYFNSVYTYSRYGCFCCLTRIKYFNLSCQTSFVTKRE